MELECTEKASFSQYAQADSQVDSQADSREDSRAIILAMWIEHQGWRIETSEPIFWLLSQADVEKNQLNNNREIAAGCPNPPALSFIYDIAGSWPCRR